MSLKSISLSEQASKGLPSPLMVKMFPPLDINLHLWEDGDLSLEPPIYSPDSIS